MDSSRTDMSSCLITALFGFSGSAVIRHSWTVSFVMRSTLGCVWIEISWWYQPPLFPLWSIIETKRAVWCADTSSLSEKASVYVTLIRNGLCYLLHLHLNEFTFSSSLSWLMSQVNTLSLVTNYSCHMSWQKYSFEESSHSFFACRSYWLSFNPHKKMPLECFNWVGELNSNWISQICEGIIY